MTVLYVPFFISGLYVRIQLPPEDTDTLIFKKSITERIQFTAYYSRINHRCFQIIIRLLYFFFPSPFFVSCTREFLGYMNKVEMEFSFWDCSVQGNKISFWHSHLKDEQCRLKIARRYTGLMQVTMEF